MDHHPSASCRDARRQQALWRGRTASVQLVAKASFWSMGLVVRYRFPGGAGLSQTPPPPHKSCTRASSAAHSPLCRIRSVATPTCIQLATYLPERMRMCLNSVHVHGLCKYVRCMCALCARAACVCVWGGGGACACTHVCAHLQPWRRIRHAPRSAPSRCDHTFIMNSSHPPLALVLGCRLPRCMCVVQAENNNEHPTIIDPVHGTANPTAYIQTAPKATALT